MTPVTEVPFDLMEVELIQRLCAASVPFAATPSGT
jgi:hypothetical protein